MKRGNKIENILSEKSISGLLAGAIAAIVIRDFYPKDLCQLISEKLIRDPRRGFFVKDNKISRIGMPHFDIVDPPSFLKYHEEAREAIDKLRKVFHPYQSPIDYLRLLLDETWPAGAHLENLYGRKCFVGICRILEKDAGIRPHTDKLSRDSADSYTAQSLLGQLAANIYLTVPSRGGELELWLNEPEESEYQKLINETGLFSVAREKIGPPDVVLKPEQGDLILFSARSYHAVKATEAGIRANIGAFIGYKGPAHPLSFWS